MPRGTFAREPEPWGAPFTATPEPVSACGGIHCIGDPDSQDFLISVGPRGTVVLHPDDAPVLLRHPDHRHSGCCGLHGRDGMNMLCPCGAEVGTEISDCGTAYELHLHPLHIIELITSGTTGLDRSDSA